MIPYVRDIDIEYGRCDTVSPLIRRVTANNPGPFTYRGTGTYIVGHGEVAVIDPGPDIAEHLEAILAALKGETVTHIVVTHHHSDHSPLSRPLAARTGAKVWGCAVRDLPAPGEVRLEAGYDRFVPDIPVCDGAVIEGAGWTLEAIPTPGHTSNHICYALAAENALFSGDHIMGWSTTVITPPDGDMGDYLRSLELIRDRDFSVLWPTHGPPVADVRPFLDAYIDHRKDRERQIIERLTAGETRIKEMVPTLYAAVDSRLWPAAAHSVMAHMLELVRAGRVASQGDPTLDSEYRLVR
ncbi:MAG TPA: MBL fold metallo-hydrolase [Caulobacteraceae bacterium]|jgi:glyoxylase-like metal-dependent hydrolase (beta-lactamase superfamily II)|nr:MBL fold metallo-hydrolase [Caulobacteraceae bacterium]